MSDCPYCKGKGVLRGLNDSPGDSSFIFCSMCDATGKAKCGATFELANGEYVSPCKLDAGHAGDHRGRCLGSPCVWPQGYTSEQDWANDTYCELCHGLVDLNKPHGYDAQTQLYRCADCNFDE